MPLSFAIWACRTLVILSIHSHGVPSSQVSFLDGLSLTCCTQVWVHYICLAILYIGVSSFSFFFFHFEVVIVL